ncbi:MAG TPA: DUF2218 domain-containing protein [Streptosporangiaceae bacterium]|nr:DUF2218 domain-containing protein [Streptosporangiaceae bacterium]
MPSAQTRIRTQNAAAYLARLCGHLAKLTSPRRFPGHGSQPHAGGQPPAVLHAEHTRDAGTITLTWGQLTLRATADELTIRADAGSQENLHRIQDMTASRLHKFGRREHLDIQWIPVTGTASGQQPPGQPTTGEHGS